MKRKTKGGLLIAFPFVLLPAVLVGYGIANFVLLQVSAEAGAPSTIGSIINAVLGFAGLIAVLSFFVAIPLGIYFLSTKDKTQSKLHADDSAVKP
jgi:preprotein translocase subunit SecG